MSKNLNLQLFVVATESRVVPHSRPAFLVEAETHRDAWRVARETCRTGVGAKVRDLKNSELLHDLPLVAGELTVKRVLSTSPSRRGRPPKLTTCDLLNLAESRNINVPPRVQRVIDELTTT